MRNYSRITLILALVAVFSASDTTAQDTTFKLSDYKNPNYLYQSLDLGFGFNNALNLSKTTNTSVSTGNNSSFSLSAGADYLRFSNSLKNQSDLKISLDAYINSSFSGSKSKNPADESKTNYFRHSEQLSIDLSERYYNRNQQYFEINAALNNSFSKQIQNHETTVDTFTYSSKTNQRDSRNSVSVSFLIGKGRIEQVQDARLAIYLLDDLYKLNRNKRVATNEEVLELAGLITSLKYKRFFDSRLRKIAEITAIDSFLLRRGIAGTQDAQYFTSLNDNWNYANNPARYSGYRLFTGIEADLMYHNFKNSHEITEPERSNNEMLAKQITPGLFLVAGIKHEKPISLKLQRSASVKGSFGMRQEYSILDAFETSIIDTVTKFYQESLPSVRLTADYGYGYYPNSRTWLRINWSLDAGWDKRMAGITREDKKDVQKDLYIYTGPELQAYYYLSEKIRLNLYFYGEFNLGNTKYTAEDIIDENSKERSAGWIHSLQASLTYSLF